MIVCKKPIPLYDVDVLGAVGVVVLALATWWLAAAPWQKTWQRHRDMVAKRNTAQARFQVDMAESERFGQELAHLEGVVAAQAAEVPRADALSQLLREMTDVAKQAQLELLNVVPQPATPDGPYQVSDIQVSGRGRSRDFIQFLDQLALGNPYQSLRLCSITRPGNATQPTCDLSWTVRLYLLPSAPDLGSGGKP